MTGNKLKTNIIDTGGGEKKNKTMKIYKEFGMKN